MEWYVYRENINRRTIEPFNIFDHYSFTQGCIKALKKNKDNKKDFAETVKRELMYYFWSKCEWEILISSWLSHENDRAIKVDVYEQVILNYSQFIDYLWSHKDELKKVKRRVIK